MKSKIWLVCILLLALLNIWWFWPGNLYFLNDDLLHIPLTEQGHLFQTNSVRPVHELLVKLELFLWGKNASGYHATALLLHLIVCFQLYNLCFVMQERWLKIEPQQAKAAALLAVILFLTYPESSEALAWIIGRAPALCAVFFMITVRIFFVQNFSLPVYVIGAFFFAVALFAYEQIVLVPISLLLITIKNKENLKHRAMHIYIIILSLVDVAYIVARKLITSEVIGKYEGQNFLSLNWQEVSANTFRLLFRLMLNPANKEVFIVTSIAFLLIVALIIFYARKISSNRKAVVFFTAIVVLLLAPVVSLGVAVNSFESGRYLYLPSVFLIIAISIAGVSVYYQSVYSRRYLIALSIFLIAYWLFGKYTASRDYRDASLYEEALQNKIQQHFKNSSDTLYIDTLRLTINRLPVNRVGFETGVKWFNNGIDTKKMVVRYYYDEVIHR